MLGVKITRVPRVPRPPREPRESRVPRLAWTIAGWNPALTAGVAALIALIIHEATYHLANGDEYSLIVLASGSRVFELSHGGLDLVGGGLLAVGVLLLIDQARKHARRPT